MDEWMEHRGELYDRVIYRGRALRARRRLLPVVAGAVVVVAVVGAFVMRPTDTARVVAGPGASAPTSTAPTAPGPLEVLAGTWYRHGVDLTITPAGHATMEWRVYTVCGQDPPPCDNLQGNEVDDGGRATLELHMTSPTTASGTVVVTSDSSSLQLGPIQARFDEQHDLLFVDPFPGPGKPFCGPRATDQRCGA